MDKAPLCSINHCLIWEAEFQTLHFSELISRREFCGTYFVAGSMRSSSNPFLDLLSSKVTCDRGCRFDGNKIHTFRGTRNTNVRLLRWISFSCLSSIPWTRVSCDNSAPSSSDSVQYNSIFRIIRDKNSPRWIWGICPWALRPLVMAFPRYLLFKECTGQLSAQLLV